MHSASGLTRILDDLESSGYARREPDPANRRSTLVVRAEVFRGITTGLD
ncbi:DNA-binding MarR family transcriptional regulator [Amycolatopsis lexingtonensis]|uniref:DNA-binding MarR family transcriptional regulator n=1 Tax=Amycolatopsis lexingtonensis TaxID=218822 RepID=A0ABR9HQ76_9PSEU|nr:hypothetical protein [Amycolatopsis lexingtonensis]MBE1492907.1 DNA-binding MarR family transcriptional regulator [Amycolatopsis lexingtonensis]